MKLIFEYGSPNYGFLNTYEHIYNHIDIQYPEIEKVRVEKSGHCDHPGGRCSISNMTIINPDTAKAVVLSFWDRGMEVLTANSWEAGWPKDFEIVHVIGGLGIHPDRLANVNVKFTPFLYPLEHEYVYRHIEQYRTPYIFEEKKKKACFIGKLYQSRQVILDRMQGHPLIDVFDTTAGYFGESYFQKMNEYALTLSFNGNGEWCMRDFESMGLGIPVVRSEALTPLYSPLVPNVDYIRGSDPAMDAWMMYGYQREQTIADQFVDAIERALKEPELLTQMSTRNVQYFDECVYPDKIGKKFFEIFDLNVLR